MNKLIILCGLPGSGKSTYAKKYLENDATILSSDKLRKELFNDETNQENNDLVFNTLYARAKDLLASGKNVVIDATNINVFERKRVLDNFKDLNIERICIFIDTNIKKCYEQDNTRHRTVGENVINHFYKILEKPTISEGFDKVQIIKNK